MTSKEKSASLLTCLSRPQPAFRIRFFLRIRILIRPKNQKRIRILVKYCTDITKNEPNIFLSPLFGKQNLSFYIDFTCAGPAKGGGRRRMFYVKVLSLDDKNE